jgi:RND family efflux transporter MFP subunit
VPHTQRAADFGEGHRASRNKTRHDASLRARHACLFAFLRGVTEELATQSAYLRDDRLGLHTNGRVETVELLPSRPWISRPAVSMVTVFSHLTLTGLKSITCRIRRVVYDLFFAGVAVDVLTKDAKLDLLRLDRGAGRPRSRMNIVAGAILLVAVTAVGVWIAMATRRVAVVPTAVATLRPSASVPTSVLNASGYVVARRRATVSSKITAIVKNVLVEEGLRVRAGDTLAELDDAQARSTVALAEAQLASTQQRVVEERVFLRDAELRFKRSERLAQEGLLARADLEAAQVQMDAFAARVAHIELDIAAMEKQVALRRIELSDTVVLAPFDGIVVSKDAQPGETISPISGGGRFTRTGIGTIVDMSSLEVEVDVSETFINRVTPRQPVIATLDAYPEWQIPAYVITTIPSADRQKATVLVRIAFETLDPRILPDMGVKVSFLQEAGSASPADKENRRP